MGGRGEDTMYTSLFKGVSCWAAKKLYLINQWSGERGECLRKGGGGGVRTGVFSLRSQTVSGLWLDFEEETTASNY